MKRLIRILDFETSGLDPSVDRICEVATIDVQLEEAGNDFAFSRGEIWSTLVDPERPIPPDSSGIHDITDEMVVGKPKFPTLIGRLKAGPPDAYCAHNSRFDSEFFRPDRIPWLDTYRLALWLWPEAPSFKLNALRYWLRLKLSPPPEVVQRAHSAAWDAYLCAAVLRRCCMEGAIWKDMLAVSNEPAVLPRFTFGKWAMKPVAEVDADYLEWMLKQQDMDVDAKHTAMVELQRRRDANVQA
jgi:exodeoxyribonuclease X